ncbi:MAG: hypothetical protein K0R15_2017 [Clostridiales bacterium]|jgi:flagellar protein FliS|nr:hypothetical protein [Clostridiales bacterium]
MVGNAISTYNDNKINTASPAELTLMLYEGMIKFANLAYMALEKKDYEKANNNIIKIENIILELQATLNVKYEVANSFNVMYVYIYERLLELNKTKKIEMLDNEILPMLRDLRETWKQVMLNSKNK